MVRVTVALPDEYWLGLRRKAEIDRVGTGRASIASVVRKLIARELSQTRLSANKAEAGKV